MRTTTRGLSVRLLALFMFATPLAAMEWQVWTSGNVIYVRVGAGLSGRQCCRGASVDEPNGGATCSQSCPANPEQTFSFGCNSLGTHTVYAYWSDDSTNGYVTESRTIEVTEPPPPGCPLFMLNPASNLVLTHKYGVADAYFGGQTADARVPLKLKAIRAPGGTPIYLKVVDPPDSAPYGPPAPRPPNDNADQSSTAGTISGAKTATVMLPATGITTVDLRTTDYASGDNYEVLASPDPALLSDPSFVCDSTTNCTRTFPITAWKRVYIETDRMFRRGAYITHDIAPCPTTPCFVPLSNLRGIGRGDTLRLIHAPRFSGAGAQTFYGEDVQVVRVDRRNDRVEVTPFMNAYYGPDVTVGSGPLPYLADAAGILSGTDAEDYYSPNTGSIIPLFNGTFVDTRFLGDDPVPYLPFEQEISGDASSLSSEATAIARKWFFHYGRPNHQHLLGGGTHISDGLQGLTTSRISTNWSWVFVQTVTDSSPRRSGGEWQFNGEVTAHEIAHQWQVNPGANTGGHCSRFQWNSATLYCSMHGDYGVAAAPCGGTCPEFYDGIVAFHYQSPTDSEYVHIRRRPEPVPQVP